MNVVSVFRLYSQRRIFAVSMLLCTGLIVSACVGVAHVRVSQSNSEIRQKLFVQTPKGTSGVDVLSFVVGTLKPRDRVNAYFRYVDAIEASTGNRPPVVPTTQRTIRVVLEERSSGLLTSKLVIALWNFDDSDRVTDITIERQTMGP